MPKLLKAIRLDDSDDQLFKTHGAAAEGEWLVTGGYAVCDFANAPHCTPRCYCESSFLAAGSRARCTIAEVTEVSEETLEEAIEKLTWHLIKGWGAPSYEIARTVAEDEIRHTEDVCETLAAEVWITVKRTPKEDGDSVDEQYSVYDRLLIGSHKL
jgi:hypothetical protein